MILPPILSAFKSCTASCTIDFCKERYFHVVMKADRLVHKVDSWGPLSGTDGRGTVAGGRRAGSLIPAGNSPILSILRTRATAEHGHSLPSAYSAVVPSRSQWSRCLVVPFQFSAFEYFSVSAFSVVPLPPSAFSLSVNFAPILRV
jgi:hypothetical protein